MVYTGLVKSSTQKNLKTIRRRERRGSAPRNRLKATSASRWVLRHDVDVCPCGSGRPVGQCCRVAGQILRVPPLGRLRPAESEPVVDGCYAAGLGGCGGKRSLEHWVSNCALSHIEGFGPIAVNGFTWADADAKWTYIPKKRLGAKILCQKHNTALSPVDDLTGRFVDFLSPQRQRSYPKHRGRTTAAFNGNDIERALLKAWCGMVASKNAIAEDTGRITLDQLPSQWLRWLYDGGSLPPLGGLILRTRVGRLADVEAGIRAAALAHRGKLYGIAFRVFTLEFLLVTADTLTHPFASFIRGGTPRPHSIQFDVGADRRELVLGGPNYRNPRPKIMVT